MPILMIGEVEHRKIREVIERARKRPVPLSLIRDAGTLDPTAVLNLKDRKPGFERPPSAHVIFPGGYRAAFSFEEQPGGMCSHLSVSVMGRAKKGMMPSPEAVAMIAEAFGVPFPPTGRAWTEEFEPGEYAINLVSLWGPQKDEGHA